MKKPEIYYAFIRWWRKYSPSALYQDALAFYQRGTRGWADRDCWSLDDYLSPLIAGAVRHLRTQNHGHPTDLTPEQWTDILLRIEEGFTARMNMAERWYMMSDEAQAQMEKEWEEGAQLFVKWYGHLWD